VESGELPLARLADASARTAALGEAPASAGVVPVDRRLGLDAARKALRIHGDPRLDSPPLVVDVRSEPTIAAGPMPWGLGPHLSELVPGTRVLSVSGADVTEVLEAAQGFRSIVVVTREAHRHPEVRALLTALCESTVDFIRVETGVPGPDGEGDRIDTFSGSYASLRAAAEYLA
jgi:beta-N-acetylhexosaminidase